MKIFIFGSNGMLGNYMKSYLSKAYEIIELTRNDYDLSRIKIESLSELLNYKNIKENDIVINCAGVIPQSLEKRGLNKRLYFTINSLFPVILSQICDKFGAKMIHVTKSMGSKNYHDLKTYRKLFDPNAVFERSPIIE